MGNKEGIRCKGRGWGIKRRVKLNTTEQAGEVRKAKSCNWRGRADAFPKEWKSSLGQLLSRGERGRGNYRFMLKDDRRGAPVSGKPDSTVLISGIG